MNGEYYLDEGDHIAISMWQRLTRLLWVLLLLTTVVIVIGAFLPELSKQRIERAERQRLTQEIERERQAKARKERQVGFLMNNPEYIESIARDKFDLMKEGDTILRMEEPKAKPSGQTQPQTQPAAPAPSVKRTLN